MTLILKSDITMDTIPEGTPALMPSMAMRASDDFSGPDGPIGGRTLPNTLGGDTTLTWVDPGGKILSGAAEQADGSQGNRFTLVPGFRDYMYSITYLEAQDGLAMTLNLRDGGLGNTPRVRVNLEKTKITLTEYSPAGATITHATATHMLSPGDEISVAVRGESPVQAAVWVNGDGIIPWTDTDFDPAGNYASILMGLTLPGFRFVDYKIYELL